MSSLGHGWKVKLSASMIVPTGNAFFATRTLGPTGTTAAAACCAPAPANMFLAMTAVTTAMTSAPTSSGSFFTSMAKSPPPCGPLEQPHTSDKLVKKPLGENRETAKSDRDSVRNCGTSLALFGAMPGVDSQGKHTAGDRHQHEELDRSSRREPQRKSRGEFHVAAPHHPGIKSAGQQNEDDSACRELDGHAGPGGHGDRQPIERSPRRNRRIESVG